MITLKSVPQISYHRRITIGGSNDLDKIPVLRVWREESSTGSTISETSQTSQTSWTAHLTLAPGRWRVEAGTMVDGNFVPEDLAALAVRAIQPRRENLHTGLDEHGEMLGLHRDPGESLPDFQKWLLDVWKRPGGRDYRGSVSNISRQLRLAEQPALLVLTGDPTTDVRIHPTLVRWSCASYVKQEPVLYVASLRGVKPQSPLRRLLRVQTRAGQELKWTRKEDVILLEEQADGQELELVYQYWKEVSTADPALTMADLLLLLNDRCANAGYLVTGRKGTCKAGLGRTGWPNRFMDQEAGSQYLHCANGTCAKYASNDPVRFALASDWSDAGGFISSEDLLPLRAMQLVGNGEPLRLEQCGERKWMAVATACPVALRELADPEVRKALSKGDYLGSPLHKIQQEMEHAFQNLWGTAAEGKAVVAPARAARYDALAPGEHQPDQVAPELFRSGVDMALSPRLYFEDLPGGKWQARVKPGFFWHGSIKHYLYADKRTASVADCTVIEIDQAMVSFEENGRELPQGLLGYRSWKLEDLARAVTGAHKVSAVYGAAFIIGTDEGATSLLRVTFDAIENAASGTGKVLDIVAISQNKALILYELSGAKDFLLWQGEETLAIDQAGLWSGGNALVGLSVISETEAYAFGDNGAILAWDGTNWAALNITTTSDLTAVGRDSSGRLWAADEDGGVWLRGVAAWTLQNLASAQPATFTHLRGDWALGTVSTQPWLLRQWAPAAKGALIKVAPASVNVGTHFHLNMLGRELTFTAAASQNNAAGEFADNATAATLLNNICTAIAASPLGGFVGVAHNSVDEINVTPLGGSGSFDMLENATLASGAITDPICVTLSNEPLWLLERPLYGATSPHFCGDGMITDGESIWYLDEQGQWMERHASGAVLAVQDHYGACVQDGQVWRIIPDEPVYADGNENLSQIAVSLRSRAGLTAIPQSLIQTMPSKIRIALGPLMAEQPGLWTSLRWEDSLSFDAIAASGHVFRNLTLALRKVSLKWRLPSVPVGNAPVVITNNAIAREDAFRDRTMQFAREEFYVDEEGWINFSRRPSLLYNPSFETQGAPGVPAGWQLVDATGNAQVASDQMRRVTRDQLEGCSFRGDAAVVLCLEDSPLRMGGLQTDVELDPAHTFSLSFVARKGLLSTGKVFQTSAQVPLAIRLIPLSETGQELSWPAESTAFDGWSDPLPLTNLWTRFAFNFGHGVRRMPEGTAKLRVRIAGLGTVSGAHLALIDAVQLEEGNLATDFADRAYGFGDDLSVEYEGSDGDYILPLEVNPALLPTNPTFGLAEVNPYVTLVPGASTEILSFDDMDLLELSSQRISLEGSGNAVYWKSLADDTGMATCRMAAGQEGWLTTAEIEFMPPVRKAVLVGVSFGPLAAPWRLGLEVSDSAARSWYLDMGDVAQGQARRIPVSAASPPGTRFRFELDGKNKVYCYLWDGSVWQLSLAAYAAEGATQPSGPVALVVQSPRGVVVPIGQSAPFTYEVADGAPTQVRVDDWNPWYNQALLQSPRPELRYDKTAHRSGVPYAVLTGANKLRWLRRFNSHDNSTEITVLEGSAPTRAASMELAPQGPVLRYREPGSLVRLTATIRSEQGFQVGGAQVKATLPAGSLGRLRAPGISPGRNLDVLSNEHGQVILDYLVPESLPWNIVKLDGGNDSYDLDDFVSPLGENPPAGVLRTASGVGAGADNSRLAIAVDEDDAPLLGGPLYSKIAMGAVHFTSTSSSVVVVTVLNGQLILDMPSPTADITLTLSDCANYGELVDAINDALTAAEYTDMVANVVCDRNLPYADPWPSFFTANLTDTNPVTIDGAWSWRWARFVPLSEVESVSEDPDETRAAVYDWTDVLTKASLFSRTDTLDRLTCLTIKQAVVPRSLSMTVNGQPQDQVDSVEECYGQPGSIFIQYDERQTQVYYHTAVVGTPDTFLLSYLRRFIFEEDGGTSLTINPAAIGLPIGCFLRIEPDLQETVNISLDGSGPEMSASLDVMSTPAPVWEDAGGDKPVRSLRIIFDQHLGDQVSSPLPGSGDALRVHLKFEKPVDTTGVAGFIFHWNACGPTGIYNEVPAPTAGAAQAGSYTDRFFYWNGQRFTPLSGQQIPLSSQKNYDIVVKWPGAAWLDDTMSDTDPDAYNEEGAIVMSRLSDQAGGGVIWEGGGIDKAIYTATVLTVDTNGRIIGSASAKMAAPDLTPPIPPEVWPTSASAQIVIQLGPEHDDLSARPFLLSPEDPAYGKLYKQIAATGALRVTYTSGTVQLRQSGRTTYAAGFKVGRLPRSGQIYGVQNLSQTWDAYSMTPELAQLLAQDQRAYLTFTEAESKNPPGLLLALPATGQGLRGSITVTIGYAEAWIEQRRTPQPEVTVRWQERNYLYRNLDTGLLQPSFSKEVKIS